MIELLDVMNVPEQKFEFSNMTAEQQASKNIVSLLYYFVQRSCLVDCLGTEIYLNKNQIYYSFKNSFLTYRKGQGN